MRPFLASLLTTAVLVVAFVLYQNAVPDTSAPKTAAETSAKTDLTALSPDQRSALRSEIRAYLLESPEVLMEAIQVLDARQKQQKAQDELSLVADNKDAIFNDGISWVGGNPDGDVTLVEFQDYRCTYCRRAHDEVHAMVKNDGNIRLIVKEFPILGEQSLVSSQLAIATLHVAGPDAYIKLANFLIKFNGNLTEKTMTGILGKLGLEPAPILAAMKDSSVSSHIGSVHDLALKLQVSGTPTFILGQKILRGYVPQATMIEMVKAVRTDNG